MSKVTDVLESLGIPYAIDGYEPKKPPQVPMYAVVFERVDDEGSDDSVMFRRVSALIELYDTGTSKCKEKRRLLHEELSANNLKHTKEPTIYFKDEKVFETEFDIDIYIEKRSF